MRLAAVLTTFLVAGVLPAAGPSGPELSLEATLAQSTYAAGEPIVLEVVLENRSSEDVRGSWLRLGETLVWEVRKVYTAERVRLAGLEEPDAEAPSRPPQELPAGGRLTVSLPVVGPDGEKTRPPLAPGNYWIAVRHRALGELGWRFPLIATAGPFEVVEPGP